MVSAGSAEGLGILEALIGTDATRRLAPILPFTLIISNNSQDTIVKSVVRYLRTNDRNERVAANVALDARSSGLNVRPGAFLIHGPSSAINSAFIALRSGRTDVLNTAERMAREDLPYLHHPILFRAPVAVLDSVVLQTGR